MMRSFLLRPALVSMALLLSAPALAQETPTPRTDIEQVRKDAMADRAVRAAVADAARNMEARLKDERRDIEVIVKASHAKAGDRVLDVASGSGYLAQVFSSLVGPAGHVDIHNTPGWIAQFPNMDPPVQKKMIKQPNIGWVTQSWADLDGPAESYDVILLGRIYHDIIVEGGDYDAINQRFFAMLKPGGYVLVEDHDADQTMPLMQQANLHRVSHGDAIGQFLRAGFAASELILIDSKYDDRRWNVFRPGVKGRTDHYIAVFQKPADGKALR